MMLKNEGSVEAYSVSYSARFALRRADVFSGRWLASLGRKLGRSSMLLALGANSSSMGKSTTMSLMSTYRKACRPSSCRTMSQVRHLAYF